MKIIRLSALFLLIFAGAVNSRTSFVITDYKWTQEEPFGSGSFPDEWKQGTFPLGLFPVTAFGGNLWMIGQKYSWSSPDGLNWTRHKKQDWGERIYTATVYFNNRLWMTGGMDYENKEFLNDIWFSDDGKNWQHSKKAEWNPRGAHCLVVFKNKLWLF